MNEWERFEDLMESDQSDPEVQYQLGLCYLHGEGTEPDGQAAERWFRRAAEQGHEGARACLASALPAEGKSHLPPLDGMTLADWCGAAEDGDAEAQYEVALF